MSSWIEPGDEFAALFRSFAGQAWRWECQGTYRQPDESAAWQRWRAGEPDELEWLRPWLENVREATRQGRGFARVRVFSERLTEYQRWQIDVTPVNLDAGEDVRVLTESQANALELPDQDFWLFDDARVAVLHFEDERFAGTEIVSDPDAVWRYRTWKARAWQHAVPFATYVQEFSQRSR